MAQTIAVTDVGKHNITLAANTVETFTITENVDRIRIIFDGADDGYYTIDGSTPTVAGTNTRRLPAGVMSVREVLMGDTFKVISAGTPTLSVERA